MRADHNHPRGGDDPASLCEPEENGVPVAIAVDAVLNNATQQKHIVVKSESCHTFTEDHNAKAGTHRR